MKKFFFEEFLRNKRGVGSITPSSPFLVRLMLATIDFDRARTIVELGPGLGPITRELLRRMGPGSTVIAFEMSKRFCDELNKIGDPRLVVRNVSALDMEQLIDAGKADYVISGLPLSTLGREFTKKLCATIANVLSPDGQYIQFQYSPLSYFFLRSYFRKVSIGFTLFNIPPAFVYRCSKKVEEER